MTCGETKARGGTEHDKAENGEQDFRGDRPGQWARRGPRGGGEMRTASIIINAIIFVSTLITLLSYFRKDGAWDIDRGLKQFRFFTVLSNTFCAVAALMMAVSQLGGDVPQPVLQIKYMATVSVTVTLLTVLLFLAPTQGGYIKWLSGDFFYMHLLGPVLAIASFCLLEKREMTLAAAMTGIIPMLLYGAVYLYKVMLAPEERRWKDFYGFNQNEKWPFACAAMLVGASAICVLFWVVCGPHH